MNTDGVCAIKPEFVISDHVRHVSLNCISDEDRIYLNRDSKSDTLDEGQPSEKRPRLSKSERKKFRGQNKSRPLPFKVERTKALCGTLVDVAEGEEAKKCGYEKCVFVHDVNEYLKNKPKDIGDTCYNYTMFGRCPRGVTCRFASQHITVDGKNKVNISEGNDFKEKRSATKNQLSLDLQNDLRKRKYDFTLAERIVQYHYSEKKKVAETTSVANGNVIKTSGAVTDEDIIKLRNAEKKKIDWKDKLYLSPLTTVGNLPFRRICKEFGADVTCGEMALCSNLLQGLPQEWALAKRHESEDLFGVQLCGNNPYVVTKCAQMLQEKTEIDFIDLNLGCPIDLIYRQGGGSGLLNRARVLENVVKCASHVLEIPFTVKTRTGLYANENVAHTLMPKFREWGASMITVHGRSREQRYTRLADWPYIDSCAASASPVPVFGNGDILSFEDYNFAKETYKNVSGIMLGRGALIKPWIFTEIKEQKLWDISSSERFDIIKKYVNYGLEHWGSDTKGVENTRRFLLEWLSFLHRYVPVGILERPPQKMNQRPPVYKGRDDMETLLASENCADWIKVSEMLLGPVPENYNFLPKHKANSYK